MQNQFKATNKLCRHGTREDCPIEKCRFVHTKPGLLYSTALKTSLPASATPAPATPTTTNGSSAKPCKYGTRDKCRNDKCRFQHAPPAPGQPAVEDRAPPLAQPAPNIGTAMKSRSVGPGDVGSLAQATDGLARYRAWLESQVEEQKARIQAISMQCSIPIPNLAMNAYGEFPAVSMMPPPVANAFPTRTVTTNTGAVSPAPRAPRFQSTPPVPGVWQPQGAPTIMQTIRPDTARASAPMPLPCFNQADRPPISAAPTVAAVNYPPGATSMAPRKVQLAYKTTPCRHFTLNRGWCPWGDECCFIHDPDLEWMPVQERSSGRSTPSSMTLVGSKSAAPGKTFAECELDPVRSVSSRSAHCWGYIQGLCPHGDENCKYIHPTDMERYIKYTPCLTWPRCGYPGRPCPLKHPQVDEFSLLHSQRRPPALNATAVAPHLQTNGPQATVYSAAPLLPQPPPQRVPSALPSTTESLIIPHDQAYASAVRHHRPTAPPAETFRPPLPSPAVRLRRPSEDVPRMAHGQAALPPGPGLAVYPGRGRRVSIAVQGLDAEYAGAALQMQAKRYVKGHMRGQSLNL